MLTETTFFFCNIQRHFVEWIVTVDRVAKTRRLWSFSLNPAARGQRANVTLKPHCATNHAYDATAFTPIRVIGSTRSSASVTLTHASDSAHVIL